eukprot:1162051-Pelagomonas_calceolata.AAC.7
MIDHSSEIHSRPARSWFQTERQKKEIAQRAGRAAAGLPPLPGDADSEDGEDAKATQLLACFNAGDADSKGGKDAQQRTKLNRGHCNPCPLGVVSSSGAAMRFCLVWFPFL